MRRLLAAALIMLATTSIATAHDARPSRWCGWWLRQHLGVADTRYNLAANWAGYGRNASGPDVGVVIVWKHHVGIIVGKTETGQWIVQSGNDGHAVRTRPRSVTGAIAFRHV